jgi:hypothetical protein
MALSGAQVAQAAYQAGWRGQALADIVSISYRESRWDPGAHRTDQPKSKLSGDMGLTQINYINWPLVSKTLGLTSRDQLFDPVTNFKAAKVLYDANGGSFNQGWGAGPGGWRQGGDPFYGVDRNRGNQAVQEAQSAGLLGGSNNYSTPAPTGNSQAAGVGAFQMPADMQVFQNKWGTFASFQVRPDLHLLYRVTPESGLQFDPRTVRKVPDNYFGATVKNWVHAGDAGELSTVALSFGNYKQFWDSILGQTLGFNHPALDPNTAGSVGVLKVLAEFAGRPDMSPAELENRLRNTNYWKSLTDSQREWNSLAPAEQQKRRAEMLTQMQDVWQQFGGVRPDGSDPRIANHLENLASGKTTFNTYVANVKTLAEALPDSPWSRQQREEAERNRQRPVDIENTAQRIRETTERWGVQWSAGTVNQWAKEMVEKFKSEDRKSVV